MTKAHCTEALAQRNRRGAAWKFGVRAAIALEKGDTAADMRLFNCMLAVMDTAATLDDRCAVVLEYGNGVHGRDFGAVQA